MKNILVTGGCGFIGSNFIHYLIKNTNYNIFNYDKLTYAGNPDNLKDIDKNKRYHFIKGDIVDYSFLKSVVERYAIDTIVNFAAESHVDRSIKDSNPFIRTNVLGVLSILNVVKEHNIRFHQISTDEVFGSLKPNDPPPNENSKYNPSSPYSASKASADFLIKSYINTYGIKATISYSTNNYGPFQHTEKLIPLSVTNLLENKKVPIYGTGKNIRNWIHVQDHCRAIHLILERGKIHSTYCISGNYEINNLNLIEKILKTMGKNKPHTSIIEFVPDRPGHDFRYSLDSKKINSELGFEPEHDFDMGLKETITWYENNREWWENLKSGNNQTT